MAARRTPPRRGVSGDCAQTDGAASREPIASATRVTSVIGHLPNDDPAVSTALELPGTICRSSPPRLRDPGSGGGATGLLGAEDPMKRAQRQEAGPCSHYTGRRNYQGRTT